MALPVLRRVKHISLNCLKNSLFNIKTVQQRSIMTSRVKLEKVLEDLRKNPYFDKYAKKIAQFQQTNPDEFLQRIEEQEKKVQVKKEKREQERKFYQSQAKPSIDTSSQTKEACLSDVMKIDMIRDKTKEEIIDIWREYHKQKDYICGTMTPEQFDKMFERGKAFSTFLLPLPREQGYEFIVTQFHGLEIHMTPLLWYQTHRENAPECLTMTHYIDLKDSKGIVLMRGEFDKNCISVQEAQCLANELQLYYATDNKERLKLLEIFTNRPNEFKHMDLVAQLETISLKSSEN